MKKLFLFIIALIMMIPTEFVQAKVGDKIGEVYNTDIVAYINHYAISSYAVNGTSCIVAEDMDFFGFAVDWDSKSRSLSIRRHSGTIISGREVRKTAPSGSKYADLLETDISVYGNGKK